MIGKALGKMDAKNFKEATTAIQKLCNIYPEILSVRITKDNVRIYTTYDREKGK